MAYCSNCGFRLNEGMKVCPGCGQTLLSGFATQVAGVVDRAAYLSEKAIPEAEKQLRSDSARFITPALFGFAFLCLFFPFVSLAMLSLSGMNLVFGFDLGFGVRAGGHWAGAILFLVILAGLSFSILSKGDRQVLMIGFAALGLLLLLGIAIGISSFISNQLGGFVQVSMGAGFYLIFLSLLAIVLVNIFFLKSINAQVRR